MNRRGQMFEVSQYFILIFFTFFIVFAGIILIIGVAGLATVDERSIADLRYQLYARQLINNPHCFAHEGVGERVDQYVIDKQKFTKQKLEECLTFVYEDTGPRMMAARITLTMKGEKPVDIHTDEWEGARTSTRAIPLSVYVKEGEKKTKASLFVQLTPYAGGST